MKNLYVLIPVMVSFLIGCGGTKQDPLADLPDAIRNAQSPNEKPGGEKPTTSDAVRVDGPESFSFMEERQDKISLRAIVLDPNYTGQLEIVDLKSYPGATFDSKTGEFQWTPLKGVVAEGNYREMDLEVRVFGIPKKSEGVALISSRKIHLFVHRKMVTPEVVSLTVNAPSLREGRNYSVSVVVRDPDGGAGAGEAPELIILPPAMVNQTKSLAQNVSVESSTADVPKRLWTYQLKINLDGEEFTHASDFAGFRVKALNHFNQSSVEVSYRVKVYTKLDPVQSSWTDLVEVSPGHENLVPFLLYDPKGESIIDLMSVSGAPVGAEVRCSTARIGSAGCNLRWTPPYSSTPQDYTVSLTVRGRNQDTSDSETSSKRLDLRLRSKAAAAPPSTPGPTPTPTPSPAPEQPPISLPGPNPSPTPIH